MEQVTTKVRVLSILGLLLAVVIWGLNYIAQSQGAQHLGPFTFNFFRMSIGSLVVFPMVLFRNYKKNGKIQFWENSNDKINTIKGGVICGSFLIMGLFTQQLGLRYTAIGKAGFLSSLSVIFVPLIGIALKKKVYLYQWVGIIIALIGVGFLSLNNVTGIQSGDLLLMSTSFFIALHVISSGYYNKRVDNFQFTVLRFLWGAILCFIFMVLFEDINIEGIKTVFPFILFSGVVASGLAFTLMAVSQRSLNNVTTSIIMSLESVFAALSGWLILGQVMTTREIIGSIIVFSAVMGMQVYGELKNKGNIEESF